MTFEEWDPDILKEEEGVDGGDNHDMTNLAAQEMSKFVCRLCIPLNFKFTMLQHTFYMDAWWLLISSNLQEKF